MPSLVPHIIKGGIHAYSFISNLVSRMSNDSTRKFDKFDTLLSSTITATSDCLHAAFLNLHKTHLTPPTPYNIIFGYIYQYQQVQCKCATQIPSGLGCWQNHPQTTRIHHWMDPIPQFIQILIFRFQWISQEQRSSWQYSESSFQHAFIEHSGSKNTLHCHGGWPGAWNHRLTPSESMNHPNHETYSLLTPTSFFDVFTTTLAGGMAPARSGSQSISPQILAEDMISGYSLGSLDPVNWIHWFKPNNLSLFEVVLLSQVVNQHAPIYGLFDNLCYMFASIIFDAVVQVYTISPESSSAPSSSLPEGPPAPTIEVSAPANANILIFPMVFLTSHWGFQWWQW